MINRSLMRFGLRREFQGEGELWKEEDDEKGFVSCGISVRVVGFRVGNGQAQARNDNGNEEVTVRCGVGRFCWRW